MKSGKEILDKVRDENDLLLEMADAEGMPLADVLNFRVQLLKVLEETEHLPDKKSKLIKDICNAYSDYWALRMVDEAGMFYSIYPKLN